MVKLSYIGQIEKGCLGKQIPTFVAAFVRVSLWFLSRFPELGVTIFALVPKILTAAPNLLIKQDVGSRASGANFFFPFLGSPVPVHETGETSYIPFQENRGLYNLAWWPVMTPDTTAPSYWLNWRFLLCATWILIAMVCPALLIWRYEGNKNSKNGTSGETQESAGCSYKGEAWGTCLKTIHPIWLLGYRIVAFCSMLALLLADSIIHSARIFYFYTQWTFTLVTVYFGLATLLSLHGCLHYCHKVDHNKNRCVGTEERGSYIAPKLGEYADVPCIAISLDQYDEGCRQTASTWEYTSQIIFQMCAGAVALTDSVFWLVLYPFFTAKDFRLSFLVVCMHSVNAVFLLGETILNSLRFPFFRIAYFLLWTCVFVVFQWTVHAFVSMRWPYPFLELSSPYAPIWYLSVGLLHLPCFGIFILIFKIKNCCLSR